MGTGKGVSQGNAEPEVLRKLILVIIVIIFLIICNSTWLKESKWCVARECLAFPKRWLGQGHTAALCVPGKKQGTKQIGSDSWLLCCFFPRG